MATEHSLSEANKLPIRKRCDLCGGTMLREITRTVAGGDRIEPPVLVDYECQTITCNNNHG